MTGTMSRTARAAAARWGLKEAVGKLPARGTRSASPAGGYPGTHSRARRRQDSKPDSHPEGVGVDATGIWEESQCAIPGEICPSADDANPVTRRDEGQAEVSRGHSSSCV